MNIYEIDEKMKKIYQKKKEAKIKSNYFANYLFEIKDFFCLLSFELHTNID